MEESEIKELEVTVNAEEFQEILASFSAIKKRVSRLWEERLMKKNKKGKFKRFDQIRIKAHGLGELIAPITTICKTSIGTKPNTTPVFAIKFRWLQLQHITKQELYK